MNVVYINPFINSVIRVFKEMVHVNCIVGKPYCKRSGHRLHLLYHHAAVIQLSGAVNGLISMDLAQPVALSLANAFSGESYNSVDESCADALREIINVVAGNAKKEMPGGQVQLSIAQLLPTHRLKFPATARVIIVPFDTDRGRLVIEVAIREMGEVAHPGTAAAPASAAAPDAPATDIPKTASIAPAAESRATAA